MRWRLILEEYNPEFIYMQGVKNITADTLSSTITIKPNMSSLVEYFSLAWGDDQHPVILKTSCSTNKTINLKLTLLN